jgi:hypothetical protein
VTFPDRLRRLENVRWGSAAAVTPRAKELVLDYYAHLGPYLPAGRTRLEPADRAIEARILLTRSDDERQRIRTAVAKLLAAARRRGERVEATTQKLVALALAWALESDGDDPGEPLVELFEAGYMIAYTHAGIEIWSALGPTTLPVPGVGAAT